MLCAGQEANRLGSKLPSLKASTDPEDFLVKMFVFLSSSQWEHDPSVVRQKITNLRASAQEI
jgi:hypothetical protein